MRWILLTLVLANMGYYVRQTLLKPAVRHSVESAIPRGSPRNEITLLNEVSSSSLQELQELVNQPSVQVTQDPGELKCSAIGPFSSIFEGQNVGRQLEALGLKLTTRAVDEPSGRSDYRLLIPPLGSVEEAFRKLRELQASKIDGYVITGGPSELGVSMGVFSTKEAAEREQKKIRSIGFEGAIVPILRTNRTYWLFAEPGAAVEISETVWENLQNANKTLSRTDFSCE